MKHADDTTSLRVIARSPFHIYYEGAARRVSAANKVGPFDILPGHADFFSVMNPGKVVVEPETGDEPVSFNITSGIVAVRDNEVMLFANM